MTKIHMSGRKDESEGQLAQMMETGGGIFFQEKMKSLALGA